MQPFRNSWNWNIAVASAIAIGGPGAYLDVVTAILGMAVKFSCCTLAVAYE